MESKLRQRLFSQKCLWGREKGLKWGPAAIFYLLEREREREREMSRMQKAKDEDEDAGIVLVHETE